MITVFLHGSFSTPQDAWWPWLKKEIEKSGQKVLAPQFPVDRWDKVGELTVEDYQPRAKLSDWFKKFEEIKEAVIADKNRFFIGHSLGPLFLLHLLENYQFKVRGAVLLAPFFEIYGKSAVVEKFNQPFYKYDFNFDKLQQLMPRSTVIFSDDDPYVDNEKSLDFAKKLSSRIVKVHDLGHMGLESGMKEFPEVLREIKMLK